MPLPNFTLTPPTAPLRRADVQRKPRTSAFANRGAAAERAVQKALAAWAGQRPEREFNRLTDTRAARRIVKSAPADFDYYMGRTAHNLNHAHGLIEVKETKHAYRLQHSKVPQLPRLLKRERCGGTCAVLVYHSSTNQWRSITPQWMDSHREGGSWDLSDLALYPTAVAALQGWLPAAFQEG